jgi:GntR family transcriptional regulator, transcriptional repressor for pyruvate dehydrogenase complex
MNTPDLLEQFDQVKTRRTHEHIIDQVLHLVESGDLKPGDQLPTERVLAVRMGISRNVLREAFYVLEDRGLIYSRHGGGRYLRALPPSNESTIDSRVRLQQAAILDVWEVREALELQAARLAAQRTTENEIHDMQELVDQLEMLDERPPQEDTLNERIELDHKFHISIAVASGNHILLRELERYLWALSSMQTHVLRALDRQREHGQHYRLIMQAIIDKDEQKAVDLLYDHLRSARRKYEGKDATSDKSR